MWIMILTLAVLIGVPSFIAGWVAGVYAELRAYRRQYRVLTRRM